MQKPKTSGIFGGGKFGGAAKQETLPAPARLTACVSGQMLSVEEKQGVLGGAQWVPPHCTLQIQRGTDGAPSCKCQPVISKPKNEIGCVLNI